MKRAGGFTRKIEDAQAELAAQRKVIDALAQLPDEASIHRVMSALSYLMKADEMVPGLLKRLSSTVNSPSPEKPEESK